MVKDTLADVSLTEEWRVGLQTGQSLNGLVLGKGWGEEGGGERKGRREKGGGERWREGRGGSDSQLLRSFTELREAGRGRQSHTGCCIL